MKKPLMETYCAWCGEFLRLVACCADQTDEISHGICKECCQKSLKELEEIKRSKTKSSSKSEAKM